MLKNLCAFLLVTFTAAAFAEPMSHTPEAGAAPEETLDHVDIPPLTKLSAYGGLSVESGLNPGGSLSEEQKKQFDQGIEKLVRLVNSRTVSRSKHGLNRVIVGSEFRGPQSDWSFSVTIPWSAGEEEIRKFLLEQFAQSETVKSNHQALIDDFRKKKDALLYGPTEAHFLIGGANYDEKLSFSEIKKQQEKFYTYLQKNIAFFNSKEIRAIYFEGRTGKHSDYDDARNLWLNLDAAEWPRTGVLLPSLPKRGSVPRAPGVRR